MGNENSGNPNPVQSDEFKAHQFGGEKANPSYHEIEGAPRPHEISKFMTYYAGQPADPDDRDAMKKLITHDGKRVPTVAQTIAAAILTRASTGNIQAAECAMDRMEGKVALPIRQEGLPPNLPPPVFHINMHPEPIKKPEEKAP